MIKTFLGSLPTEGSQVGKKQGGGLLHGGPPALEFPSQRHLKTELFQLAFLYEVLFIFVFMNVYKVYGILCSLLATLGTASTLERKDIDQNF